MDGNIGHLIMSNPAQDQSSRKQMLLTSEILTVWTLRGELQIQVWRCPNCGDKRYVNHNPGLCPNCLYPKTFVPGHILDDDVQPVTTAATVTTRTCVCGADISHLRPQAQTCSPKCRKQLSRANAGHKE